MAYTREFNSLLGGFVDATGDVPGDGVFPVELSAGKHLNTNWRATVRAFTNTLTGKIWFLRRAESDQGFQSRHKRPVGLVFAFAFMSS